MPVGIFVSQHRRAPNGPTMHRVYRVYESSANEVFAVVLDRQVSIRDRETVTVWGDNRREGNEVKFSLDALPHLIEILQSFLPTTPTVGSTDSD